MQFRRTMSSCKKLDRSLTKQLMCDVDSFMFDCDGVLWGGPRVMEGAVETVEKLRKLGKKIFFMTNNSSKSRRQYLEKCAQLGFQNKECACPIHDGNHLIQHWKHRRCHNSFPGQKAGHHNKSASCCSLAQRTAGHRRHVTGRDLRSLFCVLQEEIMCTAYAAAQYLHNVKFTGKIYLVGEAGVGEELEKLGIDYTGIGPDDARGGLDDWIETELDPKINCVLVTFDRHFSFPKILKAASYTKRKDCLFLASNEDSQLPWDGEVVVPGTGTIVAAVKKAAMREPIILGKPSDHMFKVLQAKFNLDPARTVMVGDNIGTDVLMANRCGVKSLFVLSGVSTLQDVKEAEQSSEPEKNQCIPDFYLDKLGDLSALLEG